MQKKLEPGEGQLAIMLERSTTIILCFIMCYIAGILEIVYMNIQTVTHLRSHSSAILIKRQATMYHTLKMDVSGK